MLVGLTLISCQFFLSATDGHSPPAEKLDSSVCSWLPRWHFIHCLRI
jgi:hypothetical protein